MWLPWRRRKGERIVFIGTSPFDVAAVVAATPPRPEPEPGVQLGFADGSVLALAENDPRAMALREAAARLTTRD
jgi:hypothetical protein